MTCRTTHRVTAVDLDEGAVFNSSIAAGLPPNGAAVKSTPAHAVVKAAVPVTPEVPEPEAPELPEVPVTG